MIQQQLIPAEFIEVADSDSDSYCTPPWLLEIIYKILGGVDTDPCSNKYSMVKSREAFTIADDGLAHLWGRKVFCNPPYSDPYPWAERCADHKGVALFLPKCDTGVAWWQEQVARGSAMVCFLAKRVAFYKNGEKRTGSDFSSVVALMGSNAWGASRRFKAELDEHGDIWER